MSQAVSPCFTGHIERRNELIHGTLTPQHVALEATKLPTPGMAYHAENSLTGKWLIRTSRLRKENAWHGRRGTNRQHQSHKENTMNETKDLSRRKAIAL